MNRTEEYLDSLLNNVSPERMAETEKKRRRRSKDFVQDFERELNEMDLDEIDLELDQEPDGSRDREELFGRLDGVLNEAQTDGGEPASYGQAGTAFEVNTLEDDSWTGQQEVLQETRPEETMEAAPVDAPAPVVENKIQPEEISHTQEEKELMEMLAELPLEGDPDDISQFLQQESERSEASEASEASLEEIPDVSESKEAEEKPDKKEKKGLFQQLSEALFGEDDEPIEEEPSDGKEKGKKKKEKKEKKSKEKKSKEKKEKEKKPKKEKKQKEKKPKEKKPKKPKEVDLSPPLPKGPVILIALMAISVLLLVMTATSLVGYSSGISLAKEAFRAQDYVGAYQEFSGLKAKEEDKAFGDQVGLLARVQAPLFHGDALYGAGQYTMALNSYICALGRHDAASGEEAVSQVQTEYDLLADQVIAQLESKFGVSAKTAREIYGLEDRAEYTRRVVQIIQSLGLDE